jgi:aspartyl-tRNA(Asn)/glutamyl-tRNA(Gln) amidotransferase subunit C
LRDFAVYGLAWFCISGLPLAVIPAGAESQNPKIPKSAIFHAFHHKTLPHAGNSLFLFYMEVTGELIDKLADLARLQFKDEEKAGIKNDLQRMIAFVEKLREVDVSGTEPLLHMTDAMNVYREDQVKGSMQKETALANAPSAGSDYFKVPKVIKK